MQFAFGLSHFAYSVKYAIRHLRFAHLAPNMQFGTKKSLNTRIFCLMFGAPKLIAHKNHHNNRLKIKQIYRYIK